MHINPLLTLCLKNIEITGHFVLLIQLVGLLPISLQK